MQLGTEPATSEEYADLQQKLPTLSFCNHQQIEQEMLPSKMENQPNGDIAKRNGGWPNMFGQIPLDNIGVQAGLHFSGVSNDLALARWQCLSFQTSLQHQTYSGHLKMDEKSRPRSQFQAAEHPMLVFPGFLLIASRSHIPSMEAPRYSEPSAVLQAVDPGFLLRTTAFVNTTFQNQFKTYINPIRDDTRRRL